MKNSELWKKAKEVISEPAKWAQGTLATTSSGVMCGVDDEDASCYCIFGALMKAHPSDVSTLISKKMHKDFQKVMETFAPIGNWNDSHSHEEVMEAMDKMISYYEGKGE